MDAIEDIIIKRLTDKGIGTGTICAYIRDLSNIFGDQPALSLGEINKRLHMLGWDDFELDDHTFQLIMAVIESNGSLCSLSGPESVPEIRLKAGTAHEY
jgi:uncharacterized protein (DUF779 family)